MIDRGVRVVVPCQVRSLLLAGPPLAAILAAPTALRLLPPGQVIVTACGKLSMTVTPWRAGASRILGRVVAPGSGDVMVAGRGQ